MTAPARGSRHWRRRVSTLPRSGSTRRSGRRIRICARRRSAPVSTIAPSGRPSRSSASSLTSTSRESARSGWAATINPSGKWTGRSFRLCTARSSEPSSRPPSSSLVNSPLPPKRARSPVTTSPVVTIGTSSTASPGCAASRLRATMPDWARARGLRRVPRRMRKMASVFVVGIEVEELAHEVEPGEVVRAVAGAQTAAGMVENLAHQRAGQALELRVGLRGEAGEDLGQFLAADALRLLLHAGDQRLGLEPAEPGAEVRQLLLDDLLGPRDLLPAQLQVPLDQMVERV